MQGKRLSRFLVGCAVLLVLAGCVPTAPHDVSTPDRPAGPTVGLVGEELHFRVEGAACTRNHVVLHQWDWGNGKISDWMHEGEASYAWDSPGTYEVKARARCREDAAMTSVWSEVLEVLVMPLPLPPL